MEHQYTEMELLAVHELLPWETNQSIVRLTGISIDVVRQKRREEKRHNRHDIDDEELGNEEW